MLSLIKHCIAVSDKWWGWKLQTHKAMMVLTSELWQCFFLIMLFIKSAVLLSWNRYFLFFFKKKKKINLYIYEPSIKYSAAFYFYFLFTNTDWQNSGRFLNLKIQEGEAHNIFCPAYDCFQLVPVDIIESVVSKEMDKRYLQFDIKVNYQTVLPLLTCVSFY